MPEPNAYINEYDRRFLLNRNRRSPLWQQIATALEKDIHRGRFRPGDKLPAEGVLALWFGVNRHTVRRALSELQAAEMVKTVQGRGTFVHEGIVDYPVSRRTRFSENLHRQNCSPRGILISSQIRDAGDDISKVLQIQPSMPVEVLHILRKGDERSLSLSSHYFPLPRLAGIAKTFARTGSVTECLIAHGIPDFFREETRIVARPPTTEEARLLELSRKDSILETRSINVDEYSIPVDYGIARYVGDRVQLVVKTR